MGQPDALTHLQVEIASIFFELETSEGFLVAGGAALLASELITRPTEDLDLFASSPIVSVTGAKQALVDALEQRDHDVASIQDGPTFCRMVVRRAGEEVLVDLAIDSPPHTAPTITVLGPTLAPVGSCLPSSVAPRLVTSPMSTCSPNGSVRKPCWNRPSRWTQGSIAPSSHRCSARSGASRMTRSPWMTMTSGQPRPYYAPGSTN
ncbi:hypothetical protein [Nocardioides sp.]|uniref:hypothetical protein n=1 Tax=Nocardioides sp. TaxID=35761 RepID=UPI002609793C|nr:hypothetical protein [Nocardioides sp.]MDI6909818.1 hypothetical protein [Nocardioides sp.]